MQHLRYGQLAGNVGQALAAFFIAYLMLQQASVADYALLSFVLLLQAFGIALVNAVVGAPLLIILHSQPASRDGAVLRGFIWIALGIGICIALLQGVFAFFTAHAMASVWLLAAASLIQIVRHAVRSYWLNRAPQKVVLSDLLQTFGLIMPMPWLMSQPLVSLDRVGLIFVLASGVATWPLLTAIRHWFAQEPAWEDIKRGLKQQGQPAFLGVVAVELTANFHCYFVMLMSGSQAFAAIAAATLFFRPQAVILQSLQQSEKALLVQAWIANSFQQVRQMMLVMRRLATVAFTLNVSVILVVWYWQPGWLWPDPQSAASFLYALVLWSLIAFLRGARLPVSTLLQAADQFRPLTRATYVAMALTIPAVCLGWWLGGPIHSLMGVLFGEVVLALLLKQTYHSVFSAKT